MSDFFCAPPPKPAPSKPKKGECHCDYENYVFELNVDPLDRPISVYQNIVASCPVHGRKK